MEKTVTLITMMLLLLLFPVLSSGALADFMDKGSFAMDALIDPVNMLLLGIGLTFIGTRA